jgi:hypothetical protein
MLADGAWVLHQTDTNVRFLGSGSRIEITGEDHDVVEDVNLPRPIDPDGWHTIHTVLTSPVLASSEHRDHRLCSWVAWTKDGEDHLLITDSPVFICNDEGKTVEAIR